MRVGCSVRTRLCFSVFAQESSSGYTLSWICEDALSHPVSGPTSRDELELWRRQAPWETRRTRTTCMRLSKAIDTMSGSEMVWISPSPS